MSHGSLEEKAELIFQLYDFDKSKYISKDELTILMTNSLSALRHLEGGPMPSMEEVEKKTTEFFEHADLDKNERITLEEFLSYIKKDRDILATLTGYGVAKREDLGTDLAGEGDDPYYDSDIESELHPNESNESQLRANAKYGIDFEVFYDEDGNLREKENFKK